jgi:hypothetical protein
MTRFPRGTFAHAKEASQTWLARIDQLIIHRKLESHRLDYLAAQFADAGTASERAANAA